MAKTNGSSKSSSGVLLKARSKREAGSRAVTTELSKKTQVSPRLLSKPEAWGLQAWWGEVQYGENNYGTFTAPELWSSEGDSVPATNHFEWDGSNSFLFDGDLNFWLPHAGNVVRIDVNDAVADRAVQRSIDIVKVYLVVSTAVPAVVRLNDITATFYPSSGAPVVQTFSQGPMVDGTVFPTPTNFPLTHTFPIEPPNLSTVTYTGLRVQANLYMAFNGIAVFPGPADLWARVEANWR